MNRKTTIAIFLLISEIAYGTGACFEKFATSIDIQFDKNLKIEASLDTRSRLSLLRLNAFGNSVSLAKSELQGLDYADLQTIRILTEKEILSNKNEIILIRFNFGKEVMRKDPNNQDNFIIVRSRCDFLFRGTKLISRSRFIPDTNKNRWHYFDKSPGQDEIGNGFRDSLLFPGADPSLRGG